MQFFGPIHLVQLTRSRVALPEALFGCRCGVERAHKGCPHTATGDFWTPAPLIASVHPRRPTNSHPLQTFSFLFAFIVVRTGCHSTSECNTIDFFLPFLPTVRDSISLLSGAIWNTADTLFFYIRQQASFLVDSSFTPLRLVYFLLFALFHPASLPPPTTNIHNS